MSRYHLEDRLLPDEETIRDLLGDESLTAAPDLLWPPDGDAWESRLPDAKRFVYL